MSELEKNNYFIGLDIGNTNIAFAIYKEDYKIKKENTKNISELKNSLNLTKKENDVYSYKHQWRVFTNKNCTVDEFGFSIINVLNILKIKNIQIKGAIISSVVPVLNPIVKETFLKYFKLNFDKILFVSHKLNLPLLYDYPKPEEIGADRIVNACIASKIFYNNDLIIIDLGTATTFCVVHGKTFIGGCIAPGLKMAMESLSTKTAQLPLLIEFKKPKTGVVGRSTMEAIQSGFFYGWIGIIKEIINQIRLASPNRNYKVLATGGLSEYVNKEAPSIFDIVDLDLTLKGLNYIYKHCLE